VQHQGHEMKQRVQRHSFLKVQTSETSDD